MQPPRRRWGGGQRGVAPKDPKSILYTHSPVTYQIEDNEEKNTTVKGSNCIPGVKK